MTLKSRLHRLLHWEYWPMWAIYLPVMPFWFYYSLRARSFFFFSASNPGIKHGGMAMESKMDIYDLIPSRYIPATTLIDANSSPGDMLETLKKVGITFPLIAKPDIGMKAFAVCKIEDEEALAAYARSIGESFIAQELISYPKEIGIFYHRFPGKERGNITGMVDKEFLKVTGDGIHSIEELIVQQPRSAMRLEALRKLHGEKLSDILPANEEFLLVPFGSHTRGAKFTDVSHQLTPALEEKINSICTAVSGFYYGRLDIRYRDLESLLHGENICIIEINGAGSEPTHIYDPSHTLLFAWKEIIYHWKILYQISAVNRQAGHAYITFKEGLRMIAENNRREAKLKLI